jgi:serine/threonine-protein kinase HipA
VVTRSLKAWMNGELVGTWLVDRNSHAFRYDPSWLESPRRRGSLQLKGPEVRN